MADVAANRASRNGVKPPSCWLNGNSSISVPINVTTKNERPRITGDGSGFASPPRGEIISNRDAILSRRRLCSMSSTLVRGLLRGVSVSINARRGLMNRSGF